MTNPYNAGIISEDVADPRHDTSYTGQIATLKRELADACASLTATYERGLRRGMAIARENEEGPYEMEVEWDKAEAQMEREIEEAKR